MPLPSLHSKQSLHVCLKLHTRVRGISFPVAETHINPDKTLLNKSKTVKQLVLVACNLSRLHFMSLNLWPAVPWLVIWRCSVDLIILHCMISGTGSGIDGKCTSPEAVAECADYYADNPDAVQQVNTGLWLVTCRHNTELWLVNRRNTLLWLATQLNTKLWLVTCRHNTKLWLVNRDNTLLWLVTSRHNTKLWLVPRPRSPPGSAASRRECGPAGSTEQSLSSSSSSSSAIYLYLFSCILCGKYIFSTTQQYLYLRPKIDFQIMELKRKEWNYCAHHVEEVLRNPKPPTI